MKRHNIFTIIFLSVLMLVTSGCSKSTEAPEAAAEEPSVTVTSRITGEEITAEAGISSGIYTMSRYNVTAPEAKLPFPVTWSSGRLVQTECGPADFPSDGFYYSFEAKDGEDGDAIMREYMDELVSKGYSCTEDKNMINPHFTLSLPGYGEIIIKTDDGIYCFLPEGYDFDVSGTDIVNRFKVATFYTCADWEHSRDELSVKGFDGTDEGGRFYISFKPELYKEGDVITLDDFISQHSAGSSNALYYCGFLSKQAGEKMYLTIEDPTKPKLGYTYYKDLEVRILVMDDSQLIVYFYAEVDAGIGTVHKLEGIISAICEGESDFTGVDENGNCKNCGGDGYVKCRSCNGDGEKSCSRCGGDGHVANVSSHKQTSCSRCGGDGKMVCDDCDGTGRIKCPVCGGE